MLLSTFVQITSFLAYAGIVFGILMILSISIYLNKKPQMVDYIYLAVLVVAIVIAFSSFVNSKAFRYIMIILLFLAFVFYLLYFFLNQIKKDICLREVHEQIKNDTYDIYLSLDENGNILEYSNSLTEITRLTKKELLGKKGWKILFDNLNIELIDGNQFISSNAAYFLNHLDDDASKLKMLEFTMDARLYNEKETTHYLGLVQTHFLKNKKIGSAIYLYKDREKATKELKRALDEVVNQHYKAKEMLHVLMSLSEGIVLYFDYQEKLYYTTQAFSSFCDLERNELTFKEFYSLIVDEDKNLYNEQSKTINSINLTRIKFRMKIKNIVFNAVEDSIYLSKNQDELVSIIHITSIDNGNKNNEEVLSTKEAIDLMNNLARNPISKTADKYEKILNETLNETGEKLD